ncbi:unnamed protein product [Oppiella nova]|uniref:Uncharacterized protein n=1 Tax=Oppiella nova TaxID=334625 RepID=A0A7R9MG52_9ACAR|nr:unnamed protein product [Oppiella nova]CAG2175792.1 unnamed protein product [Oppiella nova]
MSTTASPNGGAGRSGGRPGGSKGNGAEPSRAKMAGANHKHK